MGAYLQPDTLDEALGILAREPVTIAAGCTDLFAATESQSLNGTVLDVTRVEGLRRIAKEATGWRIGAASTWSDVIAADLPPAFDMLKQAAREVGSVQIQNAGTVAGNICNASPAADGVPPLLSLDAQVEIGAKGGVREVALAEFLTAPRATVLMPGEMVTAIRIPEGSDKGESRFSKLGARKYLVISIVMVAARLHVQDGFVRDIALAVGACGPIATRLSALEAALRGTPVAGLPDRLQPELIAPALTPITDMRASDEYRREAAVHLLRRVLDDLTLMRNPA